MKIIFLDIDGVLVPDYQKVNDQAFPKYNDWDAEPFSIGAMNVLNNVIMTTNAKIVISSDWRLHYSLQDMKDIFCEAGILYGEDTVMGFAPIYRKINPMESYESIRANEILQWVKLHKPEHWVSVDDMNLYNGGLPESGFVHCKKPNEGLKQLGIRKEIEDKLKS